MISDGSARQAHERGFTPAFATDTMMDTRPETHDYGSRNVSPRLAWTGSSDDVISPPKGGTLSLLSLGLGRRPARFDGGNMRKRR